MHNTYKRSYRVAIFMMAISVAIFGAVKSAHADGFGSYLNPPTVGYINGLNGGFGYPSVSLGVLSAGTYNGLIYRGILAGSCIHETQIVANGITYEVTVQYSADNGLTWNNPVQCASYYPDVWIRFTFDTPITFTGVDDVLFNNEWGDRGRGALLNYVDLPTSALTVFPVSDVAILRTSRIPGDQQSVVANIPKGTSIEVLPLCAQGLLTNCNDLADLYREYNGYYWLKVKYNGGATNNESPIYVAESRVMTTVPAGQEQDIRTILATEQPQKFIPDADFPSELIMAMAKWESNDTLNNEITSVDSPFGGIMQVHPSKSGVNRNCSLNASSQRECIGDNDVVGLYWTNLAENSSITDVFGTPVNSENNKVYMNKLYTNSLYSNDNAGITNNIDDALIVLKGKYNQSTNAVSHSTITQKEMQDISTVYRYNQGHSFIKTKAIFLALNPIFSDQYILNKLTSDHPSIADWITKTITTVWLNDIRNACAGFSQDSFGTCLKIANSTKDSEGNYLSTSAFYLENVANKLPSSYNDLAQKMKDVNTSSEIMWLNSPGDLSVSDVQGNVTGFVGGAVVQNASNTVYDPDSGVATVFFPDNSHRVTVKGTANDVYGFVVHNFSDNRTFSLKDIPTTASTTHVYAIDWSAIEQGKNGVSLQIDSGDSSATVKIGSDFSDTLTPTTTAAITGTSGLRDWYTSNVAVSLNAADNPGGVGVKSTQYSLDGGPWQTYATSSLIAINGGGTHVLQYFSIDYFGNREATKSNQINIDTTVPIITHSAVNLQYQLNTPSLQFTFSATDTISGLATISATLDGVVITSPGMLDFSQAKIGNHVITIVAQSVAGTTASTSINYNVSYHFGGFLNPVRADGSGVYKLGRTLPIKFQLIDIGGNLVSTAAAHLVVTKVTDGIVGNNIIDLTASVNDIGNLFRYDLSDNQYIYNFDTRQLAAGTWQLKTILDDGKSYSILISLR